MSEPQTRFFNSVELGLFSSRISAICEEMGALLGRVAFSPNITVGGRKMKVLGEEVESQDTGDDNEERNNKL